MDQMLELDRFTKLEIQQLEVVEEEITYYPMKPMRTGMEAVTSITYQMTISFVSRLLRNPGSMRMHGSKLPEKLMDGSSLRENIILASKDTHRTAAIPVHNMCPKWPANFNGLKIVNV